MLRKDQQRRVYGVAFVNLDRPICRALIVRLDSLEKVAAAKADTMWGSPGS